jgi:phage recombination protein Bet
MAGAATGRMPMTGTVKVFQEGMSQRHTARCECGWQSSTGSLRAAQDLATEHRQGGCPDSPPSVQLVPATTGTAPAAVDRVGEWSGEQLQILKRDLGIKNDQHLAYFSQVCQHKNLDPFLGEIIPVYYGGELVIQETVEGLRTIAERSGLYDGFIGPEWCGPDMVWKPVWLDDTPPAAARYAVRRKDWAEPATGVARWKSSVQLDRHGKPMPLWRDRPDEMLGKTAEVRALKRAFPKEFARAGIVVRDLSDAQVVTVEARRAGLDDDARHALAARVSGGRTQSTRELTDAETLEIRAEVARRQPEPEPDAVARTIARAAGDLERRMETLTADQVDQIKQWRRAQGLTHPLRTMSAADRTRIAAELDRRDRDGWTDAPQPPEPTDEDDIAPDDVADPFDDTEPF